MTTSVTRSNTGLEVAPEAPGMVERFSTLMRHPALLALVAGLLATELSFRVRDNLSSSLDPQSLLKLLIWVAPLYFLARWPGDVLRLIMTPPVSWLTMYYGLGFVFAPWSETPLASAGASVSFICLLIGVSWALQVFGWRRTLVVLAVTLLAIDLAHAAWELVTPVPIREFGSGGDSLIPGLRRIQGINNSPTVISVGAGLLVLLGAAILEERMTPRRVAFACMAVGGVLLLWTQSRASILALGLIMVLAAARRRLTVMLTGMAVGLAALVIITPGTALSILEDNFVREGVNPEVSADLTSARSIIWPIAYEMAAERPMIGWGVGASRSALSNETLERIGTIIPSAHNFGLQVFFSLGLVGLVVMLFAHVSYIVSARRSPNFWRDSIVIFIFVQGLADSVVGEVNPRAATYVWFAAFAIGAVDRRQVLLSRVGEADTHPGDWGRLKEVPAAIGARWVVVPVVALLALLVTYASLYVARSEEYETTAVVALLDTNEPTGLDRTAVTAGSLIRPSNNAVALAQGPAVSSTVRSRTRASGSLSITSPFRADLVEFTATSGDATDAAELANTTAVVFAEVYDREALIDTGRVVDQLDAQIDALDRRAELLGDELVDADERDVLTGLRRELEGQRRRAVLLGELAGRAAVIQDADVPSQPSSPRPVRDFGIALVLGVVLGGLVAALLTLRNRRVGDGEAVADATGLRPYVVRDRMDPDLGRLISELEHDDGSVVLIVGSGPRAPAQELAESLHASLRARHVASAVVHYDGDVALHSSRQADTTLVFSSRPLELTDLAELWAVFERVLLVVVPESDATAVIADVRRLRRFGADEIDVVIAGSEFSTPERTLVDS